MKSRSQKKNLSRSRQSQRRKIQSGGMSVEDAIKLLSSFGCGEEEASAATSIMTKKGIFGKPKVDDQIFHGAVFLHNKYDKRWKDAALTSLVYEGNLDKISDEQEKAKKKAIRAHIFRQYKHLTPVSN